MSDSTSNPDDDRNNARKRLSQLLNEVAERSDGKLPRKTYYRELLERLLEALTAVAGSVWIRTPAGHLERQYAINYHQTGIESNDQTRESHESLLRLVYGEGESRYLMPQSFLSEIFLNRPPPGNPSPFVLLLVPIRQSEEVVGLIEVFQGDNRPTTAINGYLLYMKLMADHAGRYESNRLGS